MGIITRLTLVLSLLLLGSFPSDLLAKGVDLQLEKAVEVLQGDVVQWKKKNEPTGVATTGEDGKTSIPKKD